MYFIDWRVDFLRPSRHCAWLDYSNGAKWSHNIVRFFVNIYIQNPELLFKLSNVTINFYFPGVDFWTSPIANGTVDVMVSPKNYRPVVNFLQHYQIPYKVIWNIPFINQIFTYKCHSDKKTKKEMDNSLTKFWFIKKYQNWDEDFI